MVVENRQFSESWLNYGPFLKEKYFYQVKIKFLPSLKNLTCPKDASEILLFIQTLLKQCKENKFTITIFINYYYKSI